MINHARTLLLNRAAQNNYITPDTAAEYVSDAFVPVKLPTQLTLLRRVLFGSNPDARFINLRLQELMGYIHQTELAHYVYDLDPRVTYWPVAQSNFNNTSRSQIIITQIKGQPQNITIVGNFVPNHNTGTALHQYIITAGVQEPALPMTAMRLTSPDIENTVLAIQQLGTTAEPQIFALGAAGNTATATLPQTELKIPLNFAESPSLYAGIGSETENQLLYESYDSSGGIETEQLAATIPLLGNLATILAQWRVTVRAVPSPVITNLMPMLELLGEPVFLALFGVDDKEPYATFKNLWFDHYSPVYRLAGLTLALIYRTEALRVTNHG